MFTSIKWIFFLAVTFLIQKGHAQTVERNVFSVFSPVSTNDTLFLAGGQILAGITNEPNIQHGYYPLNHSLLSLVEGDNLSGARIYPNPFATSFFLDLTAYGNEAIAVHIYAVNGDFIRSETINGGVHEINLANVTAGIYYVQCVTAGGVVFTEKIIKN